MRTLKTVEKNVQYLCEQYPSVRINYNVLCFWYWKEFDQLQEFTAEKLQYTTSAESIVRTFRKLVSKGIIEISNSTKTRRNKAISDYRAYNEPQFRFEGNMAYEI